MTAERIRPTLGDLHEIPEPVMAQFDRLPFSMRMRVAAQVMDAVNERYRDEHPTAGMSTNAPISASSMRFLADQWERRAYESATGVPVGRDEQ